MSIRFFLTYVFLIVALQLQASHYRAGEITYRQIGQTTYEATLITYTDVTTSTVGIDRPFIDLSWGDGVVMNVPRVSKTDIGNSTFRNIYIATHTYAGPGTFIISFQDPNRVDLIRNMDNSITVPFYIETILQINNFRGFNSSPILTLPPIDIACMGKLFIHNPGAYDPDGDSLSFRVIPPKRAPGEDVAGYNTPDFTNSFVIDPFTGQLTWDVPSFVSLYNIAIEISEYRQGQLIGLVTRDMQIRVANCPNFPPEIAAIQDTCVIAGTLLELVVSAVDSNPPVDVVTLTGAGGPFLQTVSPASLSPNPASGIDTVGTLFRWQTTCDHIRRSDYQAFIKAEDDGQIPLVDIESFNITVIAPAPEDLTLTQINSNLVLDWRRDTCLRATGYNIYRRIDSSFWTPGFCEVGVPDYTGFTLLDTVMGFNNTRYIDNGGGNGLSPGLNYCYRVTAFYAAVGDNGQPIFAPPAESKASQEVCDEILKTVPTLTNVSVVSTDVATGEMYVAWSKPTVIDTIATPGPYRYELYRAPGISGGPFTNIATFTNTSWAAFNDSIYNDVNLNTTQQHHYVLEFFSDTVSIGRSQTASSVFLTIGATDQTLNLAWQEQVPWVNSEYVIYKETTPGVFDSIATVTTNTYADTGLTNGDTSCYFVQSRGRYLTSGFIDPIINNSQIVCEVPIDTVPPCPPELTVDPGCDDFMNRLSWTNPNLTCANDVIFYRIYFKTMEAGTYTLLDTINDPNILQYLDDRAVLQRSVAGCYAITAVDSFFNESDFSQEICIENCPVYELPNVFTPNDDPFNDRYGPFPYRFIDRIELNVFNRWGQPVFSSTDPDILWDGKDQESGQLLSAGVYYYICEVYEIRREGIVKREQPLKGVIHIIRP